MSEKKGCFGLFFGGIASVFAFTIYVCSSAGGGEGDSSDKEKEKENAQKMKLYEVFEKQVGKECDNLKFTRDSIVETIKFSDGEQRSQVDKRILVVTCSNLKGKYTFNEKDLTFLGKK